MGCLQDVHWSHGSFGYFPTYSLGSFYAAQFYFQLVTESGKPQELLKDGSSSSILEWLRENIHRHGRKFTSEELCRKVTGKPLDTGFFRNYLLHKYSNIYTL
jgi:carboxypeptidase Taq